MNKVIECAGLIVVKNRKLLLAFSNNKQAWYLPGGKIDAGETALAGLQREIQEELNILIPAEELSPYYYITAPAFGEQNTTMQQHCFIHQLQQTPEPAAEIGGLHYFSREEYLLQPHQVTGVLMAFDKLQQDNLVD